jgi:hypothetical protein
MYRSTSVRISAGFIRELQKVLHNDFFIMPHTDTISQLWYFGDLSMKFKSSKKLKSLQVYFVYPAHNPVGLPMSNPNRNPLDRMCWRYCLSTSRFQKSDMFPIAVNIVTFIGVEFTWIFLTFGVTWLEKHVRKEPGFTDLHVHAVFRNFYLLLSFPLKQPNLRCFVSCLSFRWSSR